MASAFWASATRARARWASRSASSAGKRFFLFPALAALAVGVPARRRGGRVELDGAGLAPCAALWGEHGGGEHAPVQDDAERGHVQRAVGPVHDAGVHGAHPK